jgi:hypothetical protein
MKNALFITLLLFALAACNNQKKQEISDSTKSLPILNLAEQIDAKVPDTFTWNSIQKKVAFIPLETTKASLLADFNLAYADDKYIITSNPSNFNIHVFTNDGKFNYAFNNTGNGPGEYLEINHLSFLPTDSTIHIYDAGKKNLLTYSINGKHIQSTQTKGLNIGNISYLSANRTIAYNIKGEYLISVFDKDLNELSKKFPFDTVRYGKEKFKQGFFNNTTNTKDIFLINNALLTDTVFAYSDTNDWPVFVVNKGEYTIPASECSDVFKAFINLNPTYPKDFHFDIFSNYVLMKYLYKGLIIVELWDLPRGKILSRHSLQNLVTKEKFSAGFAYTLPSGNVIHALPAYVTQSKLVFVLSPEELMDDIPGLKEDDNPVLMVIEV